MRAFHIRAHNMRLWMYMIKHPWLCTGTGCGFPQWEARGTTFSFQTVAASDQKKKRM